MSAPELAQADTGVDKQRAGHKRTDPDQEQPEEKQRNRNSQRFLHGGKKLPKDIGKFLKKLDDACIGQIGNADSGNTHNTEYDKDIGDQSPENRNQCLGEQQIRSFYRQGKHQISLICEQVFIEPHSRAEHDAERERCQ